VIEKRGSTLANAGQGVFVKGKAKAGQVVAFYSGVCYSLTDIAMLHMLQPQLFDDNDYLITRHDGYILDGKPTGTFPPSLSIILLQ